MEIKSDTIIDLVAGQGRIEQAIKDFKDRLDVALPALHIEHVELDNRVRKIEGRQWYITGLGTAAGTALGYALSFFKK
jgi:hypothetical protein